MLPDRVSNPGPLTYESGALPIALRGPANMAVSTVYVYTLILQSWCKSYSIHSYFPYSVLHIRRSNKNNLRKIFQISAQKIYCDPCINF